MFTAPEHLTIVAMLAEGRPVWYVAAVTKSDRRHAYAVGAKYGYPESTCLRRHEPSGQGLPAALDGLCGRLDTVAGLDAGMRTVHPVHRRTQP